MLYSIFRNKGVSKRRKPSPMSVRGTSKATSQESRRVNFMWHIVVDFICDLCYSKQYMGSCSCLLSKVSGILTRKAEALIQSVTEDQASGKSEASLHPDRKSVV